MRAARTSTRSPGRSTRRSRDRSTGRWASASLGVDLGGTKIAVGVVDARGRILDSERMPTRPERPAPEVIDDIVACVRSRWSDRLPASRPLGVGVAGQVGSNGAVLFGPNLDWHDVPLRARLANALGRPVSVLNDVQAATYGEWRYGAGRGTDDLVCVFVGTGIGGGIVADGHLRHGATGTAGEIGHLTVQRNGRKCRCPNSGCLEAYAGGWAIAERAREALATDPRGGERLLSLAGEASAVTSKTVEQAYSSGDALARALVDETMGYLACGLVSIVNGFNPKIVVLGGGVLEGFLALVPSLAEAVKARALPAAAEGLAIVPARLGGESGLVGAATYARTEADR